MDQTFLENLTAALPPTTPDIALLEGYNSHLLLDCGPITRPAHALSSAYTKDRLSLFIRKEDNLAIPIRMEGIHRARVYGALYKISTRKLIELDKWKENGVVFERKAVDVLVPFPDMELNKNVQELPAKVWFYQARRPYWEERISMHLGKFNITPSNPDYVLANTFMNDEPELNNHFRFNCKTLEIHRHKPEDAKATPAVVAYVKQKNDEAIEKPKWSIRNERDPVLDYFHRKNRELAARLEMKRKRQEKDRYIIYDPNDE